MKKRNQVTALSISFDNLDVSEKNEVLENSYNYFSKSKNTYVKLLIRLLDSSHDNIRIFACSCLGSSESHKASKALQKIFADQNNSSLLRRQSVRAIGTLSDYGSSKYVTTVLPHSDDEELIIDSLHSLGYFSDRNSRDYLLQTVRNTSISSRIRAYAAESLGLHGRKSVSTLVDMTKDNSHEVRFFAARSLGWIGDLRAIEALEVMAIVDMDVLDWIPDGGLLSQEAKIAIDLIKSKQKNKNDIIY